jgi:hypothetical protein
MHPILRVARRLVPAVQRWRALGYFLPWYAHALAALGLGTGLWLVSLDWNSPEFRWSRAAVLVGSMPVLVYVFFLIYSGPDAALRGRKSRDRDKSSPDS